MRSRMQCEARRSEPTPDAWDVCGGALVLMIFLVSTILVAVYMDRVSQDLANLVEGLVWQAGWSGVGPC